MFPKVVQIVITLLMLVSLTNPVSVVQARIFDQNISAASVTTEPNSTETLTLTPTPISALAQSAVNAVPSRTTHYYLADRVINNADFAKLAAWGVNTAIVDFDVNGSASAWRAVFTSASAAKINVVIWPSDWDNPRPNCGWEAPYPISATGDISKVKNLLDVASEYPNFIGIVNAHESFWTCTNMTFDEMAGLKTQLKAYALSKGRSIKVWNYIDNLYDKSMLPDNQIERIMDVAVTWQHCAGNVEGTCNTTSSTSALNMMQSDRNRIANSGAQVELVFLMQTFSTGGYTAKFTLQQLQDYSCQFLNTSALDGFGFYTWDAGWWSDLHNWTELLPAVQYIKSCTNSGSTIPTSTVLPPTSTPTSTVLPPASTPTSTALPPTSTPTSTALPPTSTLTSTALPPTSTLTSTALPSTNTETSTALPPVTTQTSIPPTATDPNLPVPSTSTGFLSPFANAAQTSNAGDNNGYQADPANAYADDSLVATDTNSGTKTKTSCINNGKDKHRYYDYNLNIPESAFVKGIQVRLDARSDATNGSPKICVQISWDGGATWTTARSTTGLGTTETTYILGGVSDTWGRAWIPSDFSNANFRVRVINVASNMRRDFFLDYIAVNVTY